MISLVAAFGCCTALRHGCRRTPLSSSGSSIIAMSPPVNRLTQARSRASTLTSTASGSHHPFVRDAEEGAPLVRTSFQYNGRVGNLRIPARACVLSEDKLAVRQPEESLVGDMLGKQNIKIDFIILETMTLPTSVRILLFCNEISRQFTGKGLIFIYDNNDNINRKTGSSSWIYLPFRASCRSCTMRHFYRR